MNLSGASLTCIPVRMDDGEWESALFFGLNGPDCARDSERLRAQRTVPLDLDTDVIKHDNAAVAVLRLEILPDSTEPLVGEILLLPGMHESHFETLDLLTRQPRLGCFVGDQAGEVILAQYLRLGDGEHAEFRAMLNEVVNHDAVVRLTGRYDGDAAFAAVTSHYALRDDT